MIVFGEHFTRELALGILQGHGNQFFLQPSFFVRGIGAVLRPQRKFVLHLAVNALLFPVELGGVGHVESAVAVEQRDHE